MRPHERTARPKAILMPCIRNSKTGRNQPAPLRRRGQRREIFTPNARNPSRVKLDPEVYGPSGSTVFTFHLVPNSLWLLKLRFDSLCAETSECKADRRIEWPRRG